MSPLTPVYEKYREKMQLIADVRFANAVLQWDQETYLPPKGAAMRGRQISTLSEISHRMFSEPEFGGLLEQLMGKDGLEPEQQRNVERTHEDYVKNRKYNSAFVRALSEQVNKAFHAWIEARKKNSFAIYQKELDALIVLKREEAGILGYEGHPYNALLDEFEKGSTVAQLDPVFSDILPRLRELAQRIKARPQVNDSFLKQSFPKKEQWDWGMRLVKELGFDLEAGRQDISEHPFSTSFNSRDVRITTRIDEKDFGNMTWSCIHEAGHALYEQGLRQDQYGLPLGEACSYSIHESQSRLWENNVGRGLPFWQHYFPMLATHFPSQLKGVSLDEFYRGINKVEPTLVRTESDEINYHFHVYIRYELEKRLISNELSTADIPGFWNQEYENWMGLKVPDDKRGCLQDVHWSHGSFGYFPTYSLGSFYAAQFYAKAKAEIPGLEKEIASGNTLPLLQWLREKIHNKGRFYTSEQLCEAVTGKVLDPGFFMDYLLQKYVSIYNL